MRRLKLGTVAAAMALCAIASVASAGLRTAGRYSGVVIFDRWGGCTLYSGVYLMYVSERIKDKLSDDGGACIELDAKSVSQPINPGDGLIKRMEVIGPAPASSPSAAPEALVLSTRPAFEPKQLPAFTVRAENTGDEPMVLHLERLAPTVLTKRTDQMQLTPADGPSVAMITREAFWVGDKARLTDTGENPLGKWRWSVTQPKRLERQVELKPGEAFELVIRFELPEGEYQFLAGYGGGVQAARCVASNPVGFDVVDPAGDAERVGPLLTKNDGG